LLFNEIGRSATKPTAIIAKVAAIAALASSP
jgi:hypothetical protein